MEKVLAILTEDVVFGHTLGEYILNSHVVNFRVVSFFDIVDYLQFKDSNRVHVLLADESLERSRYETDEERIILLSEEDRGEGNVIFKYQSLDITVKKLGFILREEGEGSDLRNHKLVVRAVLSERGGSGVTTFSLMLSGVLGQNRNVLFVSLDPFMSPPPDFETQDGELGELIYSLRLKKVKWIESAHTSLRHGRDFDYIFGVLCFEDINSFGREELRDFLAGLSADGRYDCVIFDMGRLPPCSPVILEKCEKIYLIGEDNRRLCNQLEWIYGSEGDARITEVTLPLVKQFQQGMPAYSEFENSELYDFVCTLVKSEGTSLSDVNTDRIKAEEKNLLLTEEKPAIAEKKNIIARLGVRL